MQHLIQKDTETTGVNEDCEADDLPKIQTKQLFSILEILYLRIIIPCFIQV